MGKECGEAAVRDVRECIISLEQEASQDFGSQVSWHLSLLKHEIEHYFPEAELCPYIRNPFRVDPSDLPIGTGEQEELIDLQSDQGAHDFFEAESLSTFWLRMKTSYKRLAKKAVSAILVFPSTWECEQGFSTFLAIKSKSRNRLAEPQHDYRCGVLCLMLPLESKHSSRRSSFIPHTDRIVR